MSTTSSHSDSKNAALAQAIDLRGGRLQQRGNFITAGEYRFTEFRRIQADAKSIHGGHVDTFAELGSVPDQPIQIAAQSIGQRVRKRGKQNARIFVLMCQMHSPVQGNHGLARTSRSRHTCRTVVMTLNQLTLCRMEEYRPLVPRVFQGADQFVHIGHDAESALRVWVLEWVRPLGCHFRQGRRAACRQFKQGFGRLTRQVVGQFQ